MTDVRIIPGNDVEQTARDLLSLAKDPTAVRTNTDDGLTFIVPQELAQEYAALLSDIQAEPEDAPRKRRTTRKES